MRAVVIQHLPFENLGTFSDVLESAGFGCRYANAVRDDLAPAHDADLIVILGGPISANDHVRFPFLKEELTLIERRVGRGLPTLGVCLGAQLIAKVMGADVRPMGHKEIGWSALTLTEAGRQSPLAQLSTPVLHWHGEMFDIPDGVERLAGTDLCPNQAFAAGDHTLALQFHAEVNETAQAQWLVGHVAELDQAGMDFDALRRDAAEWGEKNAANGARMLRQWLQALKR